MDYEKVLKKYEADLIPLLPGEDLPGIKGMYLPTDSMEDIFKKEHPGWYTKTVRVEYIPGVSVTIGCQVYKEDGSEGEYRFKTKTFSNNTPDEDTQIAQAQSNAIWLALAATGIAKDFAIAAKRFTREEKLREIDEVAKGKKAVIEEKREMTAAETFDALNLMTAAREKAKRIEAEADQQAEDESDDFDPFAAEGIAPAVSEVETEAASEPVAEPAPEPGYASEPEPAPEPEPEKPKRTRRTKAKKEEVQPEPPAEQVEIAVSEPEPVEEPPQPAASTEPVAEEPVVEEVQKTGYTIQKEDFAHERYASRYVGKTLDEISREELEAVLNYGEKAINKEFAKKIREYLGKK